MPNKILTQLSNAKNTFFVSSSGLQVTWFESWHPILDEALQSLPDRETCSHELFRQLVQYQDSTRKKIALVTVNYTPVAVIGLRQFGRFYYELISWLVIPEPMFPAKPGYWMPGIENLGVEVFIVWRGMKQPPSPSRTIRYMETVPLYQIHCSEDFEGYWRRSGHLNTVRKCRKRCHDFNFTVNAPGAAEWIIRNWGPIWEQEPYVVDNSILIAKYLEINRRHYSFMLLDNEKPVAGHTFYHHGNDLVWAITYRDPAYDSYGVGTRLMDLVFHWAQNAGYESIHLGGRHDYKIRWAPQEGELWLFKACPEPLYRVKQAVNWARSVRKKITINAVT